MVQLSRRYSRNSELINQQKLGKDITVIGAGGIGSALTTYAALMGFKSLVIWDDDKIEEHNLSTTIYPEQLLGLEKAIAAQNQATYYNSETNYDAVVDRWSFERPLEPRVFLGPDNMSTRMEVYLKWKDNPNREWLIDMRMGSLGIEVLTVTKEHDFWEEEWISDGDAIPEPCSAKHTIFAAGIAASLGLSQAFSVLQNRPYYAYINMRLVPLNVDRTHLVAKTNK